MKLENIYVVHDLILLKPTGDDYVKTKSGLIVPPTVDDRMKIISGYVMKKGKGYPTQMNQDEIMGEFKPVFIPLEVSMGDRLYFYKGIGIEINVESETFVLIRQSQVLLGEYNGFEG